MFLKPIRIKGHSSMKNSERKKLAVEIQKLYPTLTGVQIAELLLAKGDMTQVKIESHSNDVFLVYCFQKNPLFFEHYKKLFPTVYTLWILPNLLPVLTTQAPVFQKLLNGADLMLPGVEISGEAHPRMFGDLKKGQLCGVCLKGNRAPVMVGETLLSGEDMYMSGMKAKGVRCLHMMHDCVWKMGDQSEPPLLLDEKYVSIEEENVNACIGTEDGDIKLVPSLMGSLKLHGQTNEESTPAGAAAISDRCSDVIDVLDGTTDPQGACVDDVENMDRELLFCFKCALKDRIKRSDLPLLTSTFFKHMLSYCPAGCNLNLKNSSYKKLLRFLQEMEQQGFVKLKTISKGVDTIVEFDEKHRELRGIQVPDVPKRNEASGGRPEEGFTPPALSNVLCVTAAVLPLVSSYGYSKSSTMTTAELRHIVTDYVKSNDMQRENQVLLDPLLAHIALTPKEGDRSYLDWATLIGRISNKLQPACIIQFPGRSPVIQKGNVRPITIEVKSRLNNKKVTMVKNLEEFGIDVRQFAQQLQRSVAGSASTSPSEQKGRGMEMMVQGNHAAFVYKYLLDTYKLPPSYVQKVGDAAKVKLKT